MKNILNVTVQKLKVKGQKLKVLSPLSLVLCLFSITACSDYLEQVAPSEHLNSEVFASKWDAQLATNKLYGMLTEPTYGT